MWRTDHRGLHSRKQSEVSFGGSVWALYVWETEQKIEAMQDAAGWRFVRFLWPWCKMGGYGNCCCGKMVWVRIETEALEE